MENSAEYLEHNLSNIRANLVDYQISYLDYGWADDLEPKFTHSQSQSSYNTKENSNNLNLNSNSSAKSTIIRVDELLRPEPEPKLETQEELVSLADELGYPELDGEDHCLSNCLSCLGLMMALLCIASLFIWIFIGP